MSVAYFPLEMVFRITLLFMGKGANTSKIDFKRIPASIKEEKMNNNQLSELFEDSLETVNKIEDRFNHYQNVTKEEYSMIQDDNNFDGIIEARNRALGSWDILNELQPRALGAGDVTINAHLVEEIQEQDVAFHTAAVDFYEACVIWLIEIHRRFIEEL